MSKGPKTRTNTNTSTGTQTTGVDPLLTQRQNDLYAQAQALTNTPYQPYTDPRFEGFNKDQQASFEAARGAVTAGQDATSQAAGTAGLLQQFAPSQVNAQQLTPEQIQAMQIGGGPNGPGSFRPDQASAMTIGARSGAAGYEQYMNPFEDQVVGRALSDIERSRQEAQAATQAQATAAGAFGGSRSGVAQALSDREHTRAAADQAAKLRSLGFTTALGFNQGDQNRELQAGMSNQQANTQIGLGNLQAQTQAGLAGQDNTLRASLANQEADLRAKLANQSTALNAGTANQSANLQAQTANQGAGLQAGGLNLGAAGLGAQIGNQQQQMAGFGAGLLNQIGNQQQGLGQAERDFAFQQWQAARDKPYMDIGLLQALQQGGQYGSTRSSTESSTSTAPNPNRGSFLSTLGSIGGGLLGGPIGAAAGGWLTKQLGGGGA